MLDTLKTSCTGIGGLALTFVEFIPGMLRIGIAAVTLAYMFMKLRKEMK